MESFAYNNVQIFASENWYFSAFIEIFHLFLLPHSTDVLAHSKFYYSESQYRIVGILIFLNAS